jgi:hypothetical protein
VGEASARISQHTHIHGLALTHNLRDRKCICGIPQALARLDHVQIRRITGKNAGGICGDDILAKYETVHGAKNLACIHDNVRGLLCT